MGRRALDADAGLWLPESNGIHMMFMRFPIDAVFVGKPGRDAGWRPPRPLGASRPAAHGPASCPLVRGAHGVLELPGRHDRTDRRRRSVTLILLEEPAGRVEPARAGVRRARSPDDEPGVGTSSGEPSTSRSRRRASGAARRATPVCDACLPALDARLDLPPGVPIGLPADLPAALLQVEWCAAVRRAGPRRAPRTEVRGRATDRRTAGRRPSGAAGRGPASAGRCWSPCRSIATGRPSAATTRPS